MTRIFAIFLLFWIGQQSGRELATADLGRLPAALGITGSMVLLLPALAVLIANRVLKLDIRNAVGVAALYGSVSSVTFVVARNYAEGAGTPMEGYVTCLVAFMELGTLAALFYRRLALSRAEGRGGAPLASFLMETLRGRGLFLLVAGLPLGLVFVMGAVAASASYIDAPAAVRATFPQANPSIYLTTSLGITFPFMLIL